MCIVIKEHIAHVHSTFQGWDKYKTPNIPHIIVTKNYQRFSSELPYNTALPKVNKTLNI